MLIWEFSSLHFGMDSSTPPVCALQPTVEGPTVPVSLIQQSMKHVRSRDYTQDNSPHMILELLHHCFASTFKMNA
jgi:hypothetical protein